MKKIQESPPSFRVGWFKKDRLAGKTKDATMYFFEKTTYLKEKELHNRKNYFNLAKNIAKETIS